MATVDVIGGAGGNDVWEGGHRSPVAQVPVTDTPVSEDAHRDTGEEGPGGRECVCSKRALR